MVLTKLLAKSAHRLSPTSFPSYIQLQKFPRSQPSPIFLALRRSYHHGQQRPQSFFERLQEALRNTKTEWYSIPVGVGIGVVAFTQIRKNSKYRYNPDNYEVGGAGRPQQEKEIRPMGSWQVQVLSTLPLKALSYWWGRFNEITLPRILRAPGFKLYSFVFGVNLDEAAEPLENYKNLAEFFYRQLKPGCRPIDPCANAVVSPADGTVLQFGEVRASGEVEQVKGMTYSLDALLGTQRMIHACGTSPNPGELVKPKLEGESIGPRSPNMATARYGKGEDSGLSATVLAADEEFANVNGISYTLPSLLSGLPADQLEKVPESTDASIPSSASDALEVVSDVASRSVTSWFTSEPQKRLFFCVIYLAPGDYHRFHSPVSWVVERRRHFAGELYSVSPWLQSRLKDLFVLNERVVLLGRWRHGMFSMTPVGATNVGSIKIHFDRELRTNSLTHDATKADTQGGYAEASYSGASALLGGQPVKKGGEIGGFNLGSTIVLVFEAPGTSASGPPGQGGFRFCIERGQKVKVGKAIGVVEEKNADVAERNATSVRCM